MQTPKISVIILVYNGSEVVSVPFEGLRNQTFKDFEMIFVNDGSSDNSLEILNEFKKLDNRVVVIDRENGGFATAYLFGAKYARSDRILIMSHDDSMEANLLQKLYDVVLHDNSIDIVVSPVKYFDENNNITSICTTKETMSDFSDMYEKLFFGQFYSDINFKLIKKDIFIKCRNKNLFERWMELYANSKLHFINDSFGLVWAGYSRRLSWTESEEKIQNALNHFVFFAKNNVDKFSKNYNESFLLYYADYIAYIFSTLLSKKIDISVALYMFLDMDELEKFDFKKFKKRFIINYYIFFIYLFYAYQKTKSKRLLEILYKIFLDEKDMFDIKLSENVNLSCVANLFAAINNIKNEVNIYGAGQSLKYMIDLFNYFNISVKHIITSSANNESKFGYKFVRLEDAYHKDISIPVFINSITYYDDIKRNIENYNKNIVIANLHNL